MKTVLSKVRAFWEEQLYLQQRYLDRLDVTGQEALAATRRIRWSGDRLVGELLPDDVSGPDPRDFPDGGPPAGRG